MSEKRTHLYRHALPKERISQGTAVALGNFDGLHVGHQDLLRAIAAHRKHESVVVSLYPHPLERLRGESLPRLSSLAEELSLLTSLGIDALLKLHFTDQLSKMSAQEFYQSIFVAGLNAKFLAVGADVAFGRGREGNLAWLAERCERDGIELEVVDYTVREQKVGSRLIRDALKSGDVASLEELLGRHFQLRGRVVRGDGRGAGLGFATANLAAIRQQLPAHGVYAACAHLRENVYAAVVNIGTRPTFGSAAVSVEAHLLGYGGQSFYGERLCLDFVKRIRNERRFSSPKELIGQIERDIESAKGILDEQRAKLPNLLGI